MQPRNKIQISELLQPYQLTDIKATDANRNTLLHVVVKNKNLTLKETIEVLGILLDEGLDPNAENNSYKTILHLAIANTVDSNGNTALHLAIKLNEDISVIKILIDQSKNVNLKNAMGMTPFLLMIYETCGVQWSSISKNDGFMKIYHCLITKGANVNEPDIDGVSPLCYAVQYHDPKMVQLLLESGADFSVITNFGQTLMHFLASRDHKTDEEKSTKLFHKLINTGCNVHAKDIDGNTPLHYAACANYVVMMRKLIKHGVEVDARNNEKKTPLHYLADRSLSLDAAEFLLEHGANINARSIGNYTALCSAATWRDLRKSEMLQFLLKNGADLNARIFGEYSVLHEAVSHGYKDNVLLKHWIKLRVANLNCRTYHSLINGEEFKWFHKKCLEEVKTVKSTFIDSRTSLYSLLHMNLNSRRAYIYNEKLQQLVKSPKLEKQFPEFSVLILSSYREAVTRKRLMEPAKKAWLELIKISLPDECIELIFSFLSNSDLFDMIEKN